MKLPKKLKHELVYQLTRLLIAFVNILPRRMALFFGSSLGITAWSLSGRERHKIGHHLSLAYGDRLSMTEKHNIGREFFINTGKNLIDLIRFERHFEKEIKDLVEIDGLEHFDSAYRRGRGVIGISGHLGNFELMAVKIASMGYQTAVIGRQLYDPKMDQFLVSTREAMGLTNLSTTDSPRRALQWLKDGKVLGVLIDTDSSRIRSVFLPVFGRLAQTPVGQTILALRTGAALVPITCVRIPGGGYRLIIKPEIAFEASGDSERDIYDLTLLCNKAVERLIDEYKSQWIWIHNRWCAKPQKST